MHTFAKHSKVMTSLLHPKEKINQTACRELAISLISSRFKAFCHLAESLNHNASKNLHLGFPLFVNQIINHRGWEGSLEMTAFKSPTEAGSL